MRRPLLALAAAALTAALQPLQPAVRRGNVASPCSLRAAWFALRFPIDRVTDVLRCHRHRGKNSRYLQPGSGASMCDVAIACGSCIHAFFVFTAHVHGLVGRTCGRRAILPSSAAAMFRTRARCVRLSCFCVMSRQLVGVAFTLFFSQPCSWPCLSNVRVTCNLAAVRRGNAASPWSLRTVWLP